MSDLYADEPLYQVYHRDAVVRDVLEQTMEGGFYPLFGLPAVFSCQEGKVRYIERECECVCACNFVYLYVVLMYVCVFVCLI